MKNSIKLFCAIILICLSFAMGLVGCSTTNDNSNFEYSLKVGDTYYIKSVKSKDITDITIPKTYNGKQISGIDRNAFENCSSLKSVIIPDGIKEIGNNAFSGCTSLETISLPNSINEIGTGAFEGCHSLQYYNYQNGSYLGNNINNYVVLISGIDKTAQFFKVHDDCNVIYSKALYSFTNLSNIDMPYSIQDIGSMAFGLCSSLESFLVPNYIKEFSFEWFYNCDSLKSITISANVETVNIPSYSFYCKNLSEFTVYSANSKFTAKDGVLYSKDLKTLLSYPVGKTNTNFEIPSYVECLSTYAFNGCTNLTSLTMWASMKTLRSGAVINCNNLHTLNFKGTTTEWIELDNANLGWDHSFVVNEVKCSNGTLNRSKA